MIIKDIGKQEVKDFHTVKAILEELFKDKLTKIVQRKEFSPTDCLFSASTKTECKAYSMEIKEVRNTDYLNRGFVLKFTKLINMEKDNISRNPSEALNIIYLVPSLQKYYIYDLKDISLDKLERDVIKMRVKQFDENSPKAEFAVLYLPLEIAKVSGNYIIKN